MRARALPAAAALAAAAYLVTLVSAPLVDRSLDALSAYPEDYAGGPAGALVRAGYVAVAAMALALAASLAGRATLAERASAAFLIAGAATAAVLAVAPRQVSGGPLLLGAVLLFLAPAVLATRGPARLGRRAVLLGVLVPAAFVAIALAPPGAHGIVNRAADVLLGVWGLAVASVLARA